MTHLVHTFLCLVAVGQIHVFGLFCVSRYLPKSSGFCIKASQCTGAALPGLCTNNPGTVCCIPDPNEGDTVIVKNRYVSRTTFYDIFGKTRRSTSLYPYYIKALDDAGISTPEQIAAFTAQILYGTSSLKLTEEDSDGLQYEGSASLGNNQPGDGPLYRGRGIIPIRGRHMYKVLAYGISQDLEDAPESAAMPSIAFKIAAWLWNNGYQSPLNTSWNKRPLKTFAKNSKYDFVMMSHAIYQDNRTVVQTQFHTWLKLIKILNATCPSEGQGPECKVGEIRGFCKLANSGCKGRGVQDVCGEPTDIECCVACNYPVDIVFVVDSSGSVGLNNFKLMMNFVSDVSMRFYVASSKDRTQIALIRYSSTADVIFDFNQHKGHAALRQALGKVRYTRGGTNTVLALSTALNGLFNNPASGVRGKSSGVSRILILLTDGKTNNDLDVVRKSANALREEGVDIFAVGIGEGVKEIELKVIANEPKEEYVFLSASFKALKSIVPAIEDASCNEPALLEPGEPIEINVKRKEKKFFIYRNYNLDDLVVLLVNQTYGLMDFHVSLADKTPIKDTFSSCNPRENFITDMAGVGAFTDDRFCSLNPGGGIFAFTSSAKNKDLLLRAAWVKMCTRKQLYVGFKGISSLSSFEISLVNFSSINFSTDEVFLFDPKIQTNCSFNDTWSPTLPIQLRVDIPCSSPHPFSYPNPNPSLIPYLTLEHARLTQFRVYAGCTVAASGALATILTYLMLTFNGNFVGKTAEVLATNGSSLQMKNMKSKSKTKSQKKEDKKEDSDKSDSEEEKTQKAIMISLPHARFQELIRHVLLLVSVINALRRWHESRYHAEGNTFMSCKTSLQQPDKKMETGENNNPNSAPDQIQVEEEDTSNDGVHLKSKVNAGKKSIVDNGTLPFVGSSAQDGVSSLLNENISTKGKGFLSGLNEKRSENGTSMNEQESAYGSIAGRVESVMRKSSKRQLAAMVMPCFTLFTSNDHRDGETGQDDAKAREKCFENDMHISQAFCVLAIQIIFMLLIKSNKNEIACTAAAISMNYLYLAAMVWLLVEAYYRYRMAGQRMRKKSGIRKGIFYVIAWGCPLVVVPIMMIKYTRYSANPNCWISMSNVLDLAVSVPFFVVALLQLIMFGMLLITLCTYNNPSNDKEKEVMKDKLKTGLRNTFYISLLVMASWIMATISLNSFDNRYQTAFAAVNSAKGGALLLFYVILNKDTRRAALKLLEKIGLSKNSVKLKEKKLDQVPGFQENENRNNNVKFEGISSSLKNKVIKDGTQLLFRVDLFKDQQERTTSDQAEDPEQITSLKNEEDSNGPRQGKTKNTRMLTDEDEDDREGSPTKNSIVRERSNRVRKALASKISDQKAGASEKLTQAKSFFEKEWPTKC